MNLEISHDSEKELQAHSKLVVHIGVMGSGKDYHCKELGYKVIDFKDDVKQMTWDILGYMPKNEAEYELFKKTDIHLDKSFLLTGRELLQRVGTDAVRARDVDFWARQWQEKTLAELNLGNNVACADCRFPNEIGRALELRYNNHTVEFVFCDYKSDRYDAENEHLSEKLGQAGVALGFEHLRVLSNNDLFLLKEEFDKMCSLC